MVTVPKASETMVIIPNNSPSFHTEGKLLNQSLNVTDLKLAISAALEPKAKVATEIPHQKIANTTNEARTERLSAKSARK